MRDYIELQKDLMPYQFDILLADQWYSIYVQHNKTADLFTLTLYKGEELITTEPLVLGERLFRDTYQPPRFPAINLAPYDASGTAKRLTWDNLGESVYLTIDDEEEEAAEDGS